MTRSSKLARFVLQVKGVVGLVCIARGELYCKRRIVLQESACWLENCIVIWWLGE